jgi:ethanolamine utilization microcompartment shell protein EutL
MGWGKISAVIVTTLIIASVVGTLIILRKINLPSKTKLFAVITASSADVISPTPLR